MAVLRTLLFALALVGAAPVWAVQPDEVLSDPTLEARARALSKELRCMVCQNQSIDDSAAPLARDLRLLVRERLSAGDSDAQVVNYLVARYGEFVLLRPRFNLHTALLWLLPPGVLVGGALGLFLIGRNRGRPGKASESDPLTPAEEARLARLIQPGER